MPETLSLLELRDYIEKETLSVWGAINNFPFVTSPRSPEKRNISVTVLPPNSCWIGWIDGQVQMGTGSADTEGSEEGGASISCQDGI